MDAPALPSLRERKKDEVRAALAEAAVALAREVGWDAVTTEAIAQHAGVSRRTFFRYFPTKEAVVLARRGEQLERFRAELAKERAGESPAKAVRRACLALAGDYVSEKRRILGEHALFGASAALSAADVALDQAFEAVIAEAVIRRAKPGKETERRAKLYAAAALSVLRVVIGEWAARKGKLDLVEAGGDALSLVEGIAPG